MPEPEKRRSRLPAFRFPVGGWITAGLEAGHIPERLLDLLDARDEADVANTLEAREDGWVETIQSLYGADGYRRVWFDYISKLSLSDEEFAERMRVFTSRVANAEDDGDRIRLTFSAIRLWSRPNPVEYFAQMDERVTRWRMAARSSNPKQIEARGLGSAELSPKRDVD